MKKLAALVVLSLFAISLTAAGQVTIGDKKEKPPEWKPNVKGPVKKLAKDLNLSDDQRIQVESILENEQTQMHDLMKDMTISSTARAAKIKEFQTESARKINEILNDDQKKKFQELRGAGQAPEPKSSRLLTPDVTKG